MELGGKFVNSFIMKTQILERLQCVSVVEGATHSQKDGVEGNGGSWKDGAEAFVLFSAALSWFWGLVSSQYLISNRWLSHWIMAICLGWCCLGKVDLLMAGGDVEMRPVSLSCPYHSKEPIPLPLLAVCCLFVLAELGATSAVSGRLKVNLFLSEKRGGKSHFGIIPVSAVLGIWRICKARCSLLPIFMRQSRTLGILFCWWLWRSYCMLSCVSQWSHFLVACVGTQRECVGHCLIVGKGGRSYSSSNSSIPHVFGCTEFLFCIS